MEFWFEFASTYSYLSAMRIEEEARARGVTLTWKPFLLGPIFKAQGWDNSPFNLYPSKGKYMVRDMTRLATRKGLVFRLPEPFPQNALKAARIACAGAGETWLPSFTRNVYTAQFADGRDISDDDVLRAALTAAGADADAVFAQAATQEVKDRLRDNTSAAQAKGVFGAPSFVTWDGELFWGDDRLDMALDWEVSRPRTMFA
jgi:2-hydroxychromene-2-carboxylate isomerase